LKIHNIKTEKTEVFIFDKMEVAKHTNIKDLPISFLKHLLSIEEIIKLKKD